jgi:hypothetical protein
MLLNSHDSTMVARARVILRAAVLGGTLAVPLAPASGQIEPEPGTCCGARPTYEDDAYAVFGPGPVAVTTSASTVDGDFVLHVIDLTDQATAPLNTNWGAAAFFHGASWTRGTLGGVFGVTLDGAGNIYVAHTSIYSPGSFFPVDSLGIGGAGAIYKIDATTAAVSVFATLPNVQDPGVTPASESWPGLGNVNFDCERDALYATNFEDGRIYRIDAAGACLSTYDHATDTVGGCAPEAGDAPGFVARTQRVWAVQSHAGRVYYSLWSPSQIWSVAIDAGGEFIPATQKLEISLPHFMPVADISFGPTGCMLLGERTIGSDSYSGAHQSDVLEYCLSGGVWTPSASVFKVGHPALLDHSSAGGVDYDYGPGGRVWASGDALQFGPQYVYGITGMPAAGGDATVSILIDDNQDPSAVDKYEVGDVEITCPTGGCLQVLDEEILCTTDGSGDYIYTFDIRNFSGTTANWALLPSIATVPNDGSVTIAPNVIPLVPPLPGDGSASATIQIVISGGTAGQTVCFQIGLADAFFEECCGAELCVELPSCDCLQVHDVEIDEVVCQSDGTVDFQLCLTFDNLTGEVLEHAFFVPQTPGVTFTPSHVDLPSIPPGGSFTLCTTVSGATPGAELCFLLTIHDAQLNECCAQEVCVTAPDCVVVATGGCILCDGTCLDGVTREDCLAQGGAYCGDGVPCGPECAFVPTGACCVPGGQCIETIGCECDAIGGTFFPGVGCAAVQCQATGGCTRCDGTCIDGFTHDECVAIGGSYCGDGVPCGTPGCAFTPTGACCLPSGACFDTIGCECAASGGVFSAGSFCDEVQCPPPLCPGDCDNDQQVDFTDLLQVLAEWGPCSKEAPCMSDFNGDGKIDFSDLLIVLANWGPCS